MRERKLESDIRFLPGVMIILSPLSLVLPRLELNLLDTFES